MELEHVKFPSGSEVPASEPDTGLSTADVLGLGSAPSSARNLDFQQESASAISITDGTEKTTERTDMNEPTSSSSGNANAWHLDDQTVSSLDSSALRQSRRRSSSTQLPAEDKRTRSLESMGSMGGMVFGAPPYPVVSYQSGGAGGEEKRKRHPEFLNTIPRFWQLNNDVLMHEVWTVLHKAQSSWLTARDVLALLDFCKQMQLGARAPVRPPSGAVFYFDSRAGEYFRRDGYDYVKKKGSGISVREDHVQLRQGAVAVIYASYVHSAEWVDQVSGASMFHRRSYWLVNSDEKDRGVIVHYLGNLEAQIEPIVRPHDVLCECVLCCIKRENSKSDRQGESLEQILSRAETKVKTKKKKSTPIVTASIATTLNGDSLTRTERSVHGEAAKVTPSMQSLPVPSNSSKHRQAIRHRSQTKPASSFPRRRNNRKDDDDDEDDSSSSDDDDDDNDSETGSSDDDSDEETSSSSSSEDRDRRRRRRSRSTSSDSDSDSDDDSDEDERRRATASRRSRRDPLPRPPPVKSVSLRRPNILGNPLLNDHPVPAAAAVAAAATSAGALPSLQQETSRWPPQQLTVSTLVSRTTEDELAAAAAAAVDSPMLADLDDMELHFGSLLTPIHSRRVSMIGGDHSDFNRGFASPLPSLDGLEHIYIPREDDEADPFRVPQSASSTIGAIDAHLQSVKKEPDPHGLLYNGAASAAAALALPSQQQQQQLIKHPQQKTTTSAAVETAGDAEMKMDEEKPAEASKQPQPDVKGKTKAKGKETVLEAEESAEGGIAQTKQPSTSKPSARFNSNNLVVSAVSPDCLRENSRVLVVVGMSKMPETLNHRTWTEKVLPRLSVWFGEYRIPKIDNVALGVIRFICPPPFRQPQEQQQSATGTVATTTPIITPFVIKYEGRIDSLSFAMEIQPTWEVAVMGSGLKRARPSMITPMKADSAGGGGDDHQQSLLSLSAMNKRRYSLRSPVNRDQQQQGSFFNGGDEEEVEEEEDLDRSASRMVERVVRLITSSGINTAEIINELSSENGFNFLHTTVFCGASTEVVQMLLEYGADPNIKTRDADGNTALHFACEQGNVSVARVLLKAGADPNALNSQGFTPQEMIMCREENETDMDLFALLGVNPTLGAIGGTNNDESSPLMSTPRGMSFDSPRRTASGAGGPRPQTPLRSTPGAGTNNNNSIGGPNNNGNMGVPEMGSGGTHMALLREALATLTLHEHVALAMAVSRPESSSDPSTSTTLGERTQRRSGSIGEVPFMLPPATLLSAAEASSATGASKSSPPEQSGPSNSSSSSAAAAAAGGGGMIPSFDLPMGEESLTMTKDNPDSGGGSVMHDDVAMVVTENQPHILAAVGELNHAEIDQLNDEAKRIQTNVRAWLLRRKYLETREAAKKVQALAKGHLARRHFKELKDKVSATLVIQKSMRAHIQAKRVNKQHPYSQQSPLVQPGQSESKSVPMIDMRTATSPSLGPSSSSGSMGNLVPPNSVMSMRSAPGDDVSAGLLEDRRLSILPNSNPTHAADEFILSHEDIFALPDDEH